MQIQKPSAQPTLSDYVYPVLMDCDPNQGIEDEYKNRHNQLFSWRMLRQIAQVDITNFSMVKSTQSDEGRKGGMKNFDGNIEEQALLLHEKAMKREMPQEEQREGTPVDVEM